MREDVRLTLAEMLERGGRLVASEVVEAARDRRSPLHSQFEWDDNAAAIQYRNWQARSLIKQFSVTIVEPEEKLVHVPPRIDSGQREGEYRRVASVVAVASDFERAMAETSAKLNAAQRAFEHLQSLAQGQDGDNTAAILALAIRGLDTAGEALRKLH